MSEDQIVRNCAPTLAGIKTGSLFNVSISSDSDFRHDIVLFNRAMRDKGVRIIPLKVSEKYALIYLYRPDMLEHDLKDPLAASILERYGYKFKNADRCVVDLARRLNSSPVFPHEIGLFLGYPPEDVRGFIENGPRSCKLSGCWKVYGDAEAARKQFERFSKCRRIYRSLLGKGRTVENLTVRT